ncbi:two-component system response regulator NarL [Solemya pervernicosa gill symbiont]|uniref:Two-component system response regulator NarL n=2 Tax=Gammaproteobacteria incertae sedis TaxID=118884 RepID=A0A1T2L6R9_9GAMM|nr:two-component system response regulator NarL [Candidatus Reidiella endopervernicosa]OOZ40773.1 two-component system response regulator NarL [Solemya pervernicosa gill symbiont]QKQ26391.1 two-component system response regulator NarL [Candidatus Reidiella endopervernicosa]
MSENGLHTILTIDDHPLFRQGVADLISMDDSLELIGEAASGEEGLEKARALQPELILLDLNMKGMDGIMTLKAIKADESLDTRVVMLTVSDHEDNVVAALRAGADGYLLKDMEPEDILKQLSVAGQGRLAISPQLTELLAQALREDTQPNDPNEAGLTEREKEILELIAKGLSNKLIARELGITDGTVKVHVKHLLKKLNLRSRVEAAVWAVENNRKKP